MKDYRKLLQSYQDSPDFSVGVPVIVVKEMVVEMEDALELLREALVVVDMHDKEMGGVYPMPGFLPLSTRISKFLIKDQ